ncbi:phage holin [bacterium]|nr:phage holin [bacterium]
MEWGTILQQILEMAITILLPVILGFVVVWLRGQIQVQKSKLNGEQLAMAEAFVSSFVFAAEQSGLSEQISTAGEAKKAWVLAQVQTALDAKGISIDIEIISGLIEAAVYKAWSDSAPQLEG